MASEKIDTTVDPRAARLVRECVGRLRGKFLYTEDEAEQTIIAVLTKPAPRKAVGVQPAVQPWKPGDPKPPKVVEQWGKK